MDELVVTANIGDNISILAEQLLPTSRLSGADDVIQDDHGFAYAIIANIPLAPLGTAFKVGRFRFKWGVDAALDGPSKMLYPLVRKNLGFITDRGLEHLSRNTSLKSLNLSDTNIGDAGNRALEKPVRARATLPEQHPSQ